MATVPTRDSFDRVAGVGPTNKIDSSTVGQEFQGVRQIEQTGNAIQNASKQMLKIQLDAAKEANELRANDALNQIRRKSIDLTYSTEDGYSLLKGQTALERPDGQSLAQEYGTRLDEDISSVSAGLSNDHQRSLFDKQASSVRNSFNNDLERHTMQEFKTYHSSVADGALRLSQEEAQLYWNDPTKVDTAINGVEDEDGTRVGGIRQSIEQKARLTGMAATEVEAEIREAESTVHSRVVESALINKNSVYAEAYFKKNKGRMSGKDILTMEKMVNEEVEANQAYIAVGATFKEHQTAFIPNDLDRLSTLVTEAGYTAKGELSVGQELTERLQTQGSVEEALASMSVSDDAMKEAKKKAKAAGDETNWMGFLPKKVQETVAATSDKFAAGPGSKTMPTKLAMVQDAVSRLGEGASASQKDKVREYAEKQYKMLVDARDQHADNALSEAQQLLAENGGSMSELPADIRMELLKYNPAKLKEATDYAKAIREGDTVATDDEAYLNVQLNRDRLADLSDAEFQTLLLTKFAPKDRKDIVNLRREMVEGGSDSVETLNNSALNEALKGRLQSIDLDPKSKDTDDIEKVANITRFIRDDLYSIQKQQGHKLSPQDIETRIDTLFATEVDVRQTLFGKDSLYPDTTKGILELNIDDMSNTELSQVKASLQRKGIHNPNDELVIRTYRKYRMLNPKINK